MTRTGGIMSDNRLKPKQQSLSKLAQQLPDARNHQLVSFAKSGIRMLGYVFLPFDLTIAMGVLFFSEIIGIIEELV
jgi:hypothetical protein